MKQLFAGIWQWSWFSEEKQLDFNGLFLVTPEHRILVDPPPLTEEAKTVIHRYGPVDSLIITNRDHLREAAACRSEFGGCLFFPDPDAAVMELTPEHAYKDGEVLPGGMLVVRLKDQKSPGESALFLQREKGVLIVGDALIGKPAGGVSMLPADKYADAAKAKAGLRRLLQYEFDSLLVGDGASILTGAKPIVRRFLEGVSLWDGTDRPKS